MLITDLKIGEALNESIHSDGKVLVSKGTVLTPELYEKISRWISYSRRLNFQKPTTANEEKHFLGAAVPDIYDTQVATSVSRYLKNNYYIGRELSYRKRKEYSDFLTGELFDLALETMAGLIDLLTARELTPKTLVMHQRRIFENAILQKYPAPLTYLALLKKIQGASTYIHSINVAKWAVLIASYLNLKNTMERIGLNGAVLTFNLEDVSVAGLIHDAGKLEKSIHPCVLSSKSLSRERLEHVRQHTVKGVQVLQPFRKLHQKAYLCPALQHHQRFQDLAPEKGRTIHPISGVIAVADRFEAMYYSSHYRNTLHPKQEVGRMLVQDIYGDNAERFYDLYCDERYDIRLLRSDPFYAPCFALFRLTQNVLL